jgi:hypothetical protein
MGEDMRIEWLKCEKCLWFEQDVDDAIYGHCNHKPGFYQMESAGYCQDWTCGNCWGAYDAWHSRDNDTDQEIYVDHLACNPVRFG